MAFQLNQESVGQLYQEQSQAMLIYFVRRCYDGQMAVDLVAETFARAYEKRGRFRGAATADAEAWVWRIARNALTDALRRGSVERAALKRLGVQPPALEDQEIARVEELAELPALRRELARALATLSSQHRQALRLRVIGELDYAEIASRLGVSEQAARARVSRGLKALRVSLDASEGRT